MNARPHDLVLIPLDGIPTIAAGDDLAAIILAALKRSDCKLAAGDVLVVAQKIVSKAEGRTVDLRMVTPSPRAVALGHTNRGELTRQVVEDLVIQRADPRFADVAREWCQTSFSI